MIYVFMIDDHPMFIDGVKSAFDPEADRVEFVGEANLCMKAIEPLKESGADVVLLDLNMPELNGVECCKRIKKVLPDIKVVFLTGETDTALLFDAWMSGASAIVLKYCGKKELLQTMRRVIEGERIIGQNVPFFFDQIEGAKDDKVPTLTLREEEVLKLLATGLSRSEVADELHITSAAVNFHCKNLFKKFNKNRIHSLLAEARKLKVIS
ncbi:MAG: response regulator transcription factor [Chlorobi bacterium]|nr:response regulator transcription factor [Chlorobiota bacterium]